MRTMACSLLGLLVLLPCWNSVNARAWVPAPNSELQSLGGYAPDRFAEFVADGLWTSGSTIHGQQLRKPALVRYSADGQVLARAFPSDWPTGSLRSLVDGGVLYATAVQGECRVVRLHADGSTAWQSGVGNGLCLALDVDVTGAVWVATNQFPTPRGISPQRLFQVIGLRADGGSVTRVAFDDPSQDLFSMRADPLTGGVIVAGHRTLDGDPRSARSLVLKLGATGNIEWQWQSTLSATASSVKLLHVSASAGIYALSSPYLPSGFGLESKDWLIAGLSPDGVPRFDKKISFGKTVSVIGSSAPTAAGQWLALHHEGSSEGPTDGILWVVPIGANGRQGDSSEIRNAFACGSDVFYPCQMRAGSDGGVWLNSNSGIIGVDSRGRERARVNSVATEIGALPGDRVLGVIGDGRYRVDSVQSVAFGQSPRFWASLQANQRALVPVEAFASDGAVAQWLAVGEPGSASAASVLSFRSSDSAPVAWQLAFDFVGEIQLSVSLQMVCVAGSGEGAGPRRFVLQCHRRDDGSVIWADTRPPPPPPTLGPLIARTEAIVALDDGRAVAISSERGTMRQWLIDADGAVLADRALPLVDEVGVPMLLAQAIFNAEGDALITASFIGRNGVLLRLDRDGSLRFKSVIGLGDGYQPFAFASDGGAIHSGTLEYGNQELTLTRILASGEKAWQLVTDRKIADLVVVGDRIVYTLAPGLNLDGLSPRAGELVGLDASSGDQRWRLVVGGSDGDLLGLSRLDSERVALLQTERNHLRYREVLVETGAVAREQTDSCQGEFCGCTSNFCLPDQIGRSMHLLPSEQAGALRLRARVGNVLPDSGSGSSVLLLDDAGGDLASVGADQAGVSGTWFAPWASGQGLMLDWIAPARTLFASWLTFAPDAGNDPSGLRWYTLQGTLATGSPEATLDIVLSEGGRFGSGITTPRRVGGAHLRFESCDRVQFSYRFDAEENAGASGLVTLSRLVPTDHCIGFPADGAPVGANGEGISGAWFEPASSGQGLVFDAITEADTLFATWFTYDPEGAADDLHQQHWFTLQGPLGRDGQGSLAIIRTTGGTLVEGPTHNSQRVGTATITRLGCDRLRLDYQFDDSEVAGSFRSINDFRDLQRIGGCAE